MLEGIYQMFGGHAEMLTHVNNRQLGGYGPCCRTALAATYRWEVRRACASALGSCRTRISIFDSSDHSIRASLDLSTSFWAMLDAAKHLIDQREKTTTLHPGLSPTDNSCFLALSLLAVSCHRSQPPGYAGSSVWGNDVSSAMSPWISCSSQEW
jgi:hypothetical protein